MAPIPPELLDEIRRGNLLLCVGDGVTRGVLPSAAELAQELAARCDYPPTEPATLPRVAGYYELTSGRHDLVQFLRDRLDPPGTSAAGGCGSQVGGSSPQPIKLLASLARMLADRRQPPPIVTTCYDRLLERGLREAGVTLIPVVRNAEVAYAEGANVLLVWLWGVLDDPESLIVTEDDRRRFPEGRGNLSDIVRGELARRTWLMIGVDAEDQRFRDLYDNVQRGLGSHTRRAYLVGRPRDDYSRLWWQKLNAAWLDAEAEPFLAELISELDAASRPAAIPAQVGTPAPPLATLPYKLLDWYDTDDEAIFFGREQETQRLSALIHAHRLVLLYGASGTGKTSLLRAGVVPRLERADPPYAVVYVRSLEAPALGIRQAVKRQLCSAQGPSLATPLPEAGTLTDFLAAAAQALGRTLVIILDQFEGFFVGQDAPARTAFCAELKELHEARDVPVKVVLSLREDFRGHMSEIEEQIPEVSRVWMHLKPLSRSQAEQAISAPASKLGITYDGDMLGQLLDDLAAGNRDKDIMPPELQLVCSALYQVLLQAGGRRVSIEMYRQVGGAQGVLKEYLEKALGDMGPDRQLALAVLKRLVTSQGTRDIKGSRDLAAALSADLGRMERVLERMVKAQLVRPVSLNDGQGYELRHEYLLRSLEADTEEERQRKRAEELVRQEVENVRQGGETFLIAADKLAFINRFREKLWLEPAGQELMLRSALQSGSEVAYWLGRVSDPERRVAVVAAAASAADAGPAVRARAAQVLGTLDSVLGPGPSLAAEALLGLALHDPDAGVRQTSRAGVVGATSRAAGGQRATVVAHLRRETGSADRSVRDAAWETLALLPTKGLPLALWLRVWGTRARLRLASILAWPRATPGRRAMTLAVGLTLALVALAYAFSASCYYLNVDPIAGTIVIHRGFPKLLLPGLDQQVVETGILVREGNDLRVSQEGYEKLAQKGLWGLWLQRTASGAEGRAGGYRLWGQSAANALADPWRASVLWDLDRAGAQEALLQSVRAQALSGPSEWDYLYQRPGVEALSQIAPAKPEAVTPIVVDALSGVLRRNETDYREIRRNAALALSEAASGTEGRAGKDRAALNQEVTGVLLGWLPDLYSYNAQDYRVGHALGQLAATDPVLAQQIVSALVQPTPSGEDKSGNTRANAPLILGQVAAAAAAAGSQPAVLPQVAELLIARLADQEYRVRSSAASGLGYAAAASGEDELAQRSVDALTERIKQESDSSTRAWQTRSLAQILAAHPQVNLEPEAVNRLIGWVQDAQGMNQGDAALALGAIGAASGNCETAEKISRALLEGLRRGQTYYYDLDVASIRPAQILPQVLSGASQCPFVPAMIDELMQSGGGSGIPNQGEVLDLLGTAFAAKPALVNPQVTAALIESVGCSAADAPWKTPLDRVHAAITLGQAVVANPQQADAQAAAGRLIEQLTKCGASYEDTGAAYGLGLIAQSRPDLLAGIDRATMLSRLDTVSEIGRFGQVPWDPSVLAHLYDWGTQASQGAVKAFDAVFQGLADPLEPRNRQAARRSLFGVTLQSPACRRDPACETYVRGRLMAMAGSIEPHERIAANQTLAMLDIADMAREAAAGDARSRTATVSRLNALKGLTFFGEDYTWAVKQALRWLALPPTEQQYGFARGLY